MAKKQKVLVLSANPKGTRPLRLDEEVREIHEGLQRSKHRNSYEIKVCLAARSQDLRRALLDESPSIVHFCGHGAGEEGLAFEGKDGRPQMITATAIADLFSLFSDCIQCVVLNACFSQVQAREIARHINFVIGMSKAIGDKAAIEFAVGFYDAMAAGKAIPFAYKLGCASIRLAGLDESLTPILISEPKRGPATEANLTATECDPANQRSEASPTISDIRVLTWQELESHGIPTEHIMRQCMSLDYDNINGLDEASAGTIRQWRPIVESWRDGYSLLVDPGWNVIGYWHFLPLSPRLFEMACAGELEDVMIKVEEMPVMGLPGFHDVYFVVVLVKPELRSCKATRLLYEAFLERLRYLSRQNIFINSICTNAFSPEGLALCRTVGMKKLRNHKRLGEIYFLDADGISRFIKRDVELHSAYQTARSDQA